MTLKAPAITVSTLAKKPPPGLGDLRPFTVDEYHRMIQAGVLTEDDPVELLEGWIVFKMPRNPDHDLTIELAQEAIGSRLTTGWRLRVQSAITTHDSEPEPDLVVVAGSPRHRAGRHPRPDEIGIIVEVADSSLARDRNGKGPLYAGAGIAVYWIINLIDRQVEVYTKPSGPGPSAAGYGPPQTFRPGASVPLLLGGQHVADIPAGELLP